MSDEPDYTMNAEDLERAAVNLGAWAASPKAIERFTRALQGTQAAGINEQALRGGLKFAAGFLMFVQENMQEFSENDGYFDLDAHQEKSTSVRDGAANGTVNVRVGSDNRS